MSIFYDTGWLDVQNETMEDQKVALLLIWMLQDKAQVLYKSGLIIEVNQGGTRTKAWSKAQNKEWGKSSEEA